MRDRGNCGACDAGVRDGRSLSVAKSASSSAADRAPVSPLPGGAGDATTTYSLGGDDCAVTGGFVYRGTSVPAAVGRYFYGDNCSGKIRTLRVVGGRARSARTESFRLGGISSFGQDGSGELYAVTLDGRLWKLAPG